MWSESRLERLEAVEPHMGTLIGITLYARNAAEAKAGFERGFVRIAEINRRLSDYLPDSELNQLSTVPRRASRDLLKVLRFALRLAEETGGAFDPTVGPLTRAWRQRQQPPDGARELVGWKKVKISGDKVSLEKEGMHLDLGAIGKGYAADEVLAAIRALGIQRALVAASGDIVCGEAPPSAKGWRVEAAGRVLSLRHGAVSTSGDGTQFFERDGRRYSHIFDPRTGQSFTDLLEVSVVAPNGMTADALATAARVLGRAAAEPLVHRYKGKIIQL